MPFVYAAMLSSQLIVTVADRVPQFDVARSCREASVSNCLDLEKWAREKLNQSWKNYTAHEKAMCVMEEKIAGPPSYTGWLTCLDINATARRVAAAGSTGSGTPGTAMSSETKPKEASTDGEVRGGQKMRRLSLRHLRRFRPRGSDAAFTAPPWR